MPKGVYDRNKSTPPAPGAAVSAPPAVNPVRQQVKDLSGFGNREDLKNVLPESTAIAPGSEQPEKVRKPRQKKDVEDVTDERYNRAVAGMTSLGGSRAIKTVFKSAAHVTKKEELKLDKEEEQLWDDFFYVVGKKSQFDPTRPWYLVLYAIVLLGEQVVTRLWALNSDSFANSLGKFFGLGADDEALDQNKIPTEGHEDEDE